MATSNEVLFDELLRTHALFQKASFKEARNLVQRLSASDAKTNKWLRNRLEHLVAQPSVSQTEVATLLKELGIKRQAANAVAIETATVKMTAATRAGIKTTMAAMQTSLDGLPIAAQLGMPDAAAVAAQSAATPFGGFDVMHQIAEWGVNMADADRHAIEGAIKSGIANGQTTPQIMRNVEKVQAMTRDNAEAITKTALNHASNTGRNAVFEENEDIISVLRWLATLDGRTSPICRSLDGKVRPLGEGEVPDGMDALPEGGPQQPPAHLRCRSLMIAILDGEAIGDQLGPRPTVTDKRTGKRRQLDFEKNARARYNQTRGEGDPTWSKLDPKEKAPFRKAVRKEWADKHVGSAPGDTTYDEWLRKQDDAFQDQVLGKTKAQLYRDDPDMTMDKMIDSDGRPLTIKELDEGVDLKPTRPEGPGAPKRRQAAADKATAAQNDRIKRRLDAADTKAQKRVAAAEKKTVAAEKKAKVAQKKADAAEKRRLAAEKRAKVAKERANVREEKRVAREKQKLEAEKTKAPPQSDMDRAFEAQLLETDDDILMVRDQLSGAKQDLAAHQATLSKAKKGSVDFFVAEDRIKSTKLRIADAEGRLDDISLRKQRLTLERELSATREHIRATQSGFDGTSEVAHTRWVDSLSKQDRGDLYDWGDSKTNRAIRNAMKNGTDDPEMKRVIANLERLHSEAPGHKGDIYRGFKPKKAQWDQFVADGGWEEIGLHSASWDWGAAHHFATTVYHADRVNVVMRIQGSRSGRLIQSLTGHSNEHEIMMPSGRKYRIISITERKSVIGGNIHTVQEVTVEEIN